MLSHTAQAVNQRVNSVVNVSAESNGKGQNLAPGPWTTSLNQVHGPLFFIPKEKKWKKGKKRRHTTHILLLLFVAVHNRPF